MDTIVGALDKDRAVACQAAIQLMDAKLRLKRLKPAGASHL